MIPNECKSCHVSAGCLNRPMFANKLAVSIQKVIMMSSQNDFTALMLAVQTCVVLVARYCTCTSPAVHKKNIFFSYTVDVSGHADR